MSRRPLVALLTLFCCLPAVAAEGFHKWYDENGQVVYSQFPPGEGQRSDLIKPPPPPAEAPEVAQRRLQDQLQRSEDVREDKALADEKAAEQQAMASQSNQRCTQARNNLALLNGRPRQLYQLPDGTVTRMSEEQRQARRAEMQNVIDESCR